MQYELQESMQSHAVTKFFWYTINTYNSLYKDVGKDIYPNWPNNNTATPAFSTYQTFIAQYPFWNTTSISPTPPALTVTPTPTISPNATVFAITVCPHGLGNCGDNVNPLSGGNLNPLHTIRSIKLSITDTNNLPVSGSPFSGNVTYVPSAKDYQGIITIPNLSDGQFLFTVKMDGFLGKQVPGVIDVKTGQQINLAEVLVTNGDINNDNQLDIEDYNILISCYDMKYSTSSCPLRSTSQSPGADIDDDGTVNGSDYNLFLRELSVK